MSRQITDIPDSILATFRKGCVIPAMPLALNQDRSVDWIHQRALCRYYIDAGAGGIAVAVHTTQFEIRDPEFNLFQPVLKNVAQYIDQWERHRSQKLLRICGICGRTPQALDEARIAIENNYHAGLLSMAAWADGSIDQMLEHCNAVAQQIPIIGFYLQPSVGGRTLPYEFWRDFAKIPNVLGIKIAPFNRYGTLDVVRAVCEADNEISLYTGNDDNIVNDLIANYQFGSVSRRFVGGLLGHWCCWTKNAVELLDKIHAINQASEPIPQEILTLANEITDCNAAFFDPKHNFKGCIAGVHEVLRRQGLMKGIWCLDKNETLSPGQADEITRVHSQYPHLNDDQFVSQNLKAWLEHP